MVDHSSGTNGSLPHYAGNGASAPGPQGGAVAEDEITLQEIIAVLRKWKWTIAGTFAVVFLAAALYTFMQTPTYEASAMLYVNKQQASPQLGQLLGLQGASSDIANEVEILQSRTIALGVAGKLMDRRYVPGTDTLLSVLEQPDDAEEPLTRTDVMRRLRNNYVEVQPVGPEVDLINIFATSIYPREAALIAGLYSEEYVAYNREMSRKRMVTSRNYLADITERFRERLAGTRDSLLTFLKQEQVVAPEEEARVLLEQMARLQGRKYEALLAQRVAQRQLELLRRQLETITPEIAEELASSTAAVLGSLKRKIGEITTSLEAKYANNPGLRGDPTADVRRMKQKMRSLKAQVEERADKLVAQAVRSVGIPAPSEDVQGGETADLPISGTQVTLGRVRSLQSRILRQEINLETSQARLQVLSSQLSELRAEVQEIPTNEVVMNRLQRTLQAQSGVYHTLIEQLLQTRVATGSELGYVTVVDEPLVPEQPVSPRVPLNLALGLVLGLMLGAGAAFLRNAFDTQVRTPEALRHHGFSVVGVVPDLQSVIDTDFDGRERVTVDGHTYDTSLIALLNPLSPAAEAYRRLRTNLQYSRIDERVSTVLITSSGPGEGKSTTALNLAVTLAQAGRRTAYLDADLRRAMGHKKMGVTREPGFVDLLFEAPRGGFERFATDVDDLYVIPAGRSVPNPAEVVGSDKMDAFLQRLKSSFDVVVIDTPPVLAVTDAQLLAAYCDATVLVCRAGETEWAMLDHSQTALRETGAGMAGILLNRYDPKDAGAYGYGYGYGLDEYYGERPVASS